MSANSKGDRGERELRDILGSEGFAVIRAAASGTAPGFDLPDLHVSNGGYEWAIEVKRHAGDRNQYLEQSETEALLRYVDLFRTAEAKVAYRVDHDTTWYFSDPRDLRETDSGNRVLDPDTRGEDPWTTLDDLLDRAKPRENPDTNLR